jgi:hypothetical protein
MKYSEKLEEYVKTQLLGQTVADAGEFRTFVGATFTLATQILLISQSFNFFTLPSSTHRSTNQWIKPDGKEAEHGKNPNRDFVAASTFRAGVLQLLTDATTITETAGVACVAKIKGDVNQVRKSIYYVWNPSHPVPTFLTYDLYLAYTSARTL